MKNICNLIACSLLLLVICSCAPRTSMPLDPEAQQHILSTDIYVFIQQQEIYAEIQKSQMGVVMGGGLLAALIDSAVDHSSAKKAESSVQPIRDALIDYNFGQVFLNEVQNGISSIEWIRVDDVALRNDLLDERADDCYLESDASDVMFIQTKYYFFNDYENLIVVSNVYVLPKSEILKNYREDASDEPSDLDNCIYKNIFTYTETTPEEIDTKEDAIHYWSVENATATRTALENGAQNIVEQIVTDLTIAKESRS